MYTVWRDFQIDFTHSFMKETGECYMHTLDHFLTLQCSQENVIDAGVLHLVKNQSDHEPIFIVIKCGNKKPVTQVKKPDPIHVPKPKWNQASSDQKLEFNDLAFRKLSNMKVPVDAFACRNIHCEDPEHKLQIDTFVEEILELLNEAGQEALPLSKPSLKGNSKRKKLAGWKEFVEPFQESARFWHSIWISAGKPINTELHQIMKRTRNKYHYQIRRCRRIE